MSTNQSRRERRWRGAFRRDEHLGQHRVKRRVARGAPTSDLESIAGIDLGLPRLRPAADGRGIPAHATLWP